MAPWKIIFLLNGLLTTIIGIVFLFVMPDNQLNAKFLTKEERILAVERVRSNQQGIGNKHFKLYQFKEALLDPLVWAFVVYALIGKWSWLSQCSSADFSQLTSLTVEYLISSLFSSRALDSLKYKVCCTALPVEPWK